MTLDPRHFSEHEEGIPEVLCPIPPAAPMAAVPPGRPRFHDFIVNTFRIRDHSHTLLWVASLQRMQHPT